MGSQYRHRRTSVAATPFPATLEPGEIAVNTANRELAVGDANSGSLGAPIKLIAVRFFDVRAAYAAGDCIFNAGKLYVANILVAPGAFNPASWDQIGPTDLTAYVAKAGATMTGPLILNADPTVPLGASTKQSVDAALAAGLALADAQLALKAPLASPHLTGVPTAPTAPVSTNTDQLATCAFVLAQPISITTLPDGIVTFAKMAASALATAADYLANVANKILTADRVWAAAVPVVLTDAASVAPDFGTGIDFVWTLGAAGRTLANPTNAKPGQKGLIYLKGGKSITTWGSAYKFADGGTKPTLSTLADAVDVLSYAVGATGDVVCAFLKDAR